MSTSNESNGRNTLNDDLEKTNALDLLLAVDTSGGDAGLVLAGPHGIDTALLPLRDDGIARTEDLASQADSLLRRCKVAAGDLTAVAGVVGPGSYTGLRSGLAFLRGLAFADSLPAVAVGTLELLAFRAGLPGESVTVVWPAGKGRSTIAAYRCEAGVVIEISAPESCDDAQVADVIAANAHGSAVLVTPSEPEDVLRTAADRAGLEARVAVGDALVALATLVRAKLQRGQTVLVEAMLPFYVGQAAARPNSHRVATLAARVAGPE